MNDDVADFERDQADRFDRGDKALSTSSQGRYRDMTYLEAFHPSATDSICEDCGVRVVDKAAHDRFHAIENDVARTLAILQVTHISPGVHDRYESYEKIVKGRNRNNWSDEAFEEVTARHPRGGES